jgi:UDP-N-acetylmuramate: L-alanyl-gamma-D-glutamyl-meso-diaminopimelate ligase
MLAWVLTRAGRDPGFLVGGLPRNFGMPFHLGRGPAFVVEGDEYDTAFFDKGPKFMHYRPRTAILGTIEFDHADIYADLTQVETAFRRLVGIVPRRGLVVRHEDCELTRQVSAQAPCRVTGFGLGAGEWRAVDLQETEQGVRFRILRDGLDFTEVALAGSGEHSARNALAVAAAAAEQGLGPAEVAAGLASFVGVSRRLEVRGAVDGVTVVDDFAHHPTAIDVTLRAARGRWPAARVWAVCEPRSWSLRRNVFQGQLVEAFDAADEVLIAAVHEPERIAAGERLDPERLVAELGRRGRSARFLPDVGSITEHLAAEAAPGDVIVIMSNGAFGGLHDRLIEALRRRARTAVGGGSG